MNVKRITAKTTREAMRQVRETLGADAVILSNRAIPGGVEIIALPPEAMAGLTSASATPAPAHVEATPIPPASGALPVLQTVAERLDPLWNEIGQAATVVPAPSAAPGVTASTQQAGRGDWQPPAAACDTAASTITRSNATSSFAGFGVPPKPDAGVLAQSVIDEIHSLQDRLESRLDDLTWRDLPGRNPAGAALMRELLGAGFSTVLARRMMETLPAGCDTERAIDWAKDTLMQELRVMPSETAMLDGGGVFALMGPTGAGKTTTTAKLAARFVVRHGAEKIALLTTDGYRIGGHEQLRIYGKILGVSVHAVRDAADLKLALSELRNKHTVLIDTVGMSQRDRAVAEQVEMLVEAGSPIKRLLVLNATSHGETLNEVVQAYRGRDLAGCVLSKLDEAASLGPALDCALRHQLTIHYLATGQRVPEDLHLANRQYLVHRAFKARLAVSPWALDADELPFALAGMGQGGSAINDYDARVAHA